MPCPSRMRRVRCEQCHGAAITFERADVHVLGPRAYAVCKAAAREVRIHERADVFVVLVALSPQPVQIHQHRLGHAERAPDPR